MAKLPLGGKNTNYDSKKSRGLMVNMIGEGDNDQAFRSIKRCDGLTQFGTGFGPARSNILANGNHAYVISGSRLCRFNSTGVVEDLGEIGGSGEGQILSNAVPGDNQICALNGSGDGYIYDSGGLVQITDPDFFPTVSGTVLNERFWFIRLNSNEFFASDVSDGFSYNPLSFGTAEESPDFCVAIIAKRSSLWIGGTDTFEFWQTVNDLTLPVRKVRSSTIESGIRAKASLAEMGKHFAFLADDLTVKLVTANTEQTISDLDFNLKVRGNGTATMPGFTTTDDAVGFFVETATHQIYYLTFPTEGYTWGFDLTTGLTHTRESTGLNYWRAKYSTIFNGKIIMGDFLSDKMWLLDPASKAEGDEILRAKLRTPGVSFDSDITIPLIELDMEVGQIEDPTATPVMMVRYSKDGGYNWINHSDIELGTQGNYRRRMPLRNFGRLVRHKDFQLELTVTEPTRVTFYGAEMPMSMGI